VSIHNYNNTPETVLGNITYGFDAENIITYSRPDYAQKNGSFIQWVFPDNVTLAGNEYILSSAKSDYLYERYIPITIHRWTNNSIFSSDGYQLANFSVIIENTTIAYAKTEYNHIWGEIRTSENSKVNATILTDSFTTDFPIMKNYADIRHIEFANNSPVETNRVYNFSVIIKVHRIDQSGSPIEYYPRFSVSQDGTNVTSDPVMSYNATTPAFMLPNYVHYAGGSTNVSNQWSYSWDYMLGLTLNETFQNITSSPTASKIGIFRPSTHLFYLDYNGNGVWNGAVIDRAYNFGITGDIPVTGDWTSDGKTKIGVFRNSTHLFYLDYNGNGAWNGASVDKSYNFGITGDMPITGDWNNDGISEIGVFRPSTHTFYLDYNGNGVWNGASIDKQYNFGITGDMPITGDWNNNGISEIGVFRPSTHLFYLDYNGNGVWNGASIDRQYNFGITGDKPVTGKWSVPSQQLPTNIQMIANVYGLASNPSAGIDQIQYTIGLVPGSPSLNLEMMNVIFSTPTFGPKVLVWTAGTASTTDTNFIALKNGSGTSQSIMAEGDQMQIIFNMTVVPKNTKMNITSLPANGNALPFSKTTPATISTFNVLY